MQFPSGFDTDTVNFSHCNGPLQQGGFGQGGSYSINNSTLPSTLASGSPYFLGPVSGGTYGGSSDSTAYQNATDAQDGVGSRDTLTHWKQVNGFAPAAPTIPGQLCYTPPPPAQNGEACAIYFNNADLEFGRDMHCRVKNQSTGATACYVTNFGSVGTEDATLALGTQGAEGYEQSGQQSSVQQLNATVAMEYDPNPGPLSGVQFWAYGPDDKYLKNGAKLDNQGSKPIPAICIACHQGNYSGSGTVTGAAFFLPFDLDFLSRRHRNHISGSGGVAEPGLRHLAAAAVSRAQQHDRCHSAADDFAADPDRAARDRGTDPVSAGILVFQRDDKHAVHLRSGRSAFAADAGHGFPRT